MSTFREFQTGFTLGKQQQGQRKLDKARADASALFDSGIYEGAESTLMAAGDMDGASAFAEAGKRRKDTERLETYGKAMKSGGYEAVRGAAVEQGDIGMAADLDKVISSMGKEEREAAAMRADFLGQAAYGLAQIKDPNARKQAYQQIITTAGQSIGITPEQAANFDLSDASLKAVFMSSMKLSDQIKMDQEGGYTLGPGQQRRNKNNEVVAEAPPRAPGNGIQLDFGEDGALSGLSIGGTGTKGKEPAVVRGPDGAPVVTPGQQQLAANKDYQRIKSEGAQTALVREDIKRARALVGDNTTGGWAATKDIPLIGGSTKSGQLANALATIKANVGFDKLAEMRQNSPTGGALGNVSEKEIAFLQSVQGSLEQAQTAEDLEFNLKRLDEFFQNRDQRRLEAFAQDYPSLAEFTGFAKGAAAEGNALQKLSDDDLKKRAAELKAKAGKQ